MEVPWARVSLRVWTAPRRGDFGESTFPSFKTILSTVLMLFNTSGFPTTKSSLVEVSD